MEVLNYARLRSELKKNTFYLEALSESLGASKVSLLNKAIYDFLVRYNYDPYYRQSIKRYLDIV